MPSLAYGEWTPLFSTVSHDSNRQLLDRNLDVIVISVFFRVQNSTYAYCGRSAVPTAIKTTDLNVLDIVTNFRKCIWAKNLIVSCIVLVSRRLLCLGCALGILFWSLNSTVLALEF